MIKNIFNSALIVLIALTSISSSALDSTSFNQSTKIEVSNGIPCDYTGTPVSKPGESNDDSVLPGVGSSNGIVGQDLASTSFNPESNNVTAVSQTCNVAGEVSDPAPPVGSYPLQVPSGANGNVCIPNPNPRPQFCGTRTWTVPAGVTSISAVAIGGGGGGGLRSTYWMNTTSGSDIPLPGSGGGGALSYSNNIPVNQGDIVTIIVGCGGNAVDGATLQYLTASNGLPQIRGHQGFNGGDSSVRINGVTVLLAKGGNGGFSNSVGSLGDFNQAIPGVSTTPNGLGGRASDGIGQVRHSGGDGGLHGTEMSGTTYDGDSGGGGAAGYTGPGGKGIDVTAYHYNETATDLASASNSAEKLSRLPRNAQNGVGGGAAGGAARNNAELGGGGTGVYGIGANGTVPLFMTGNTYTFADYLRNGGSGGDNGGYLNAPYCQSSHGGYPGGGGSGGRNHRTNSGSLRPGHAGFGAHGAVRIVFPGTTRQFPSTNVGP